jgi:hypothetical protein
VAWKQESWVRVYRGFDMGWWPDPAYCVWAAVIGKQIVPFKERTWFKTTAKQIARDIVADSVGMKVVTTYCDPNIGIERGDEETLKAIMEKEGMAMDCATNDRVLYAHAINSALKEEVMPGVPRLQIVAGGCPYLVKSLPQMRYDEKETLKMADHKHDHPAIALAYILMNVMPMTAATTLTTVPMWMRKDKGSTKRLGHYNVRR